MNNDRDFKGIWIPKDIWLSTELTLQEKVFLVEIDSLDNENGCFASNSYFAHFFNLSRRRVSEIIKSLIDKKYLNSELLYKKNSNEIDKRVLKVSSIPYGRKPPYPMEENFRDNNTLNNTFNNKEKIIKKEFFSVENLSGKVLGKIDIPSYENQQEFELITEQLNIQTPKEKEKSSAKKEKETFEPFLADLSDYFRSVGMFTQTRLENAKELICVAKNNQTELFKESVKNYKTVLADPTFYFKYKWDLFTFLKQQKGKSSVNWLRFVSGGDIWDSYLLQKKMESLKKEESAPTVMGRAPIRK